MEHSIRWEQRGTLTCLVEKDPENGPFQDSNFEAQSEARWESLPFRSECSQKLAGPVGLEGRWSRNECTRGRRGIPGKIPARVSFDKLRPDPSEPLLTRASYVFETIGTRGSSIGTRAFLDYAAKQIFTSSLISRNLFSSTRTPGSKLLHRMSFKTRTNLLTFLHYA